MCGVCVDMYMYQLIYLTVCTCVYTYMERRSYWSIPRGSLTAHTCDIENCEGWLSPGGHSSGGRALTAKVRGRRFNPGWLPDFHGSLKIFPSLSSCTYPL